MTPLMVEVLMKCYSTHAKPDRIEAPAVKQVVMDFEANGIIQPVMNPPGTPGGHDQVAYWKCTEMGKAFVELILDTPFPVKRYVDPRTNKVITSGAIYTIGQIGGQQDGETAAE